MGREKLEKWPSVKDGKPAGDKLKAALTKYKNGIKNKYKPLFDRIEKQLEYFLDYYIRNAAAALAAVATYSKVREDASTQLLIAGAEFQRFEQGGSKGTFEPSNKRDLLPKLIRNVRISAAGFAYSVGAGLTLDRTSAGRSK